MIQNFYGFGFLFFFFHYKQSEVAKPCVNLPNKHNENETIFIWVFQVTSDKIAQKE